MKPDGLIFHMSRCGSTLVSQMLASVEECRVMSEPPAVEDVLQLGSVARLRTMVSALGQASEFERHYFLKLDCWHIRHFDLIHEAFPETPAAFLFRNPLEVLVSQMRNPGVWTLCGHGDREGHIAELLGEMMETALHHAGSLEFVEYGRLPEAVFGLFGKEWTAAQQEKMRAAAGCDAKLPIVRFVDDGEAKRAEASEAARTAAARVEGLYQRMRSA